jgi:hypothetical protein
LSRSQRAADLISSSLRRVEFAVAAVLTLFASSLHLLVALSAGPLWRDEANTVGLATLPTLSDVWANLQYDSFPMLWVLLVRHLSTAFGPMNDHAFRLAGLGIGLSGIAVLWIGARAFGHRVPLVSLALFAISPSVIRWGDALRGYGLGMALAMIACVCIWRFAEYGGRSAFAAALAVSLLSVHTTFYNATVLLSACTGAFCICAVDRRWRRGAAAIAIGFLAAISVLPYLSTISRASSWNSLVQIPVYDLPWFLLKLSLTLNTAGEWAFTVWLIAFLLTVSAAVKETLPGNRLGLSPTERRLTVFAAVTLTVGAVSNYVFLKQLSYYTQPWYYLTVIALTAICMEGISGALVRTRSARIARLVAVVLIATLTAVNAGRSLRIRMTNVDVIASGLESRSTERDLIVMTPWYAGITFGRYFDGDASWTMLPDLEFSRFHRFDLFMAAMTEPNQAAPAESVLNRTSMALRAGGSVYIVGDGSLWERRSTRQLPPADLPQDGWRSFLYQDQWSGMLVDYLNRHARTIELVEFASPIPVSRYEDMRVRVARGWRE